MNNSGPGAAHALIQADDQVAGAVLRELDAFHGDGGIAADEQAEGNRGTGDGDERVVQGFGGFRYTAGFQRTVPGTVGIDETVTSPVSGGVRISRRAEQAETDDAVIDGNTVFAVVQERSAVGGVPQNGPAMSADLKPVGVILTGPVSGAGNITELNLVIRVVRVDARIEGNLQQTVAFLPVRLGNKLKLFFLGGEPDPLGDDGSREAGGDLQLRKQAAGTDNLRLILSNIRGRSRKRWKTLEGVRTRSRSSCRRTRERSSPFFEMTARSREFCMT